MRTEPAPSRKLYAASLLALGLTLGGCHFQELVGVHYHAASKTELNRQDAKDAKQNDLPTTAPASRPAEEDGPSAADLLKGVEQWAQN